MDDPLILGLLVLAYGIPVPHALAGLMTLLDPRLKQANEDTPRLARNRT